MFNYPKRKLRKMVKNGDYREALEFGASIEGRHARDPDFLFIMGSIHYLLENADRALHYFDRSLRIHDSDTETLLLKANVHEALGNNREARSCCRRILDVDRDNAAARRMMDRIGSGGGA